MGGGTEPDNLRGFGRVHLEAGLPLNGQGNLALLVADSLTTSIAEFEQISYDVEVDATAGLELRATLSWIDPPTPAASTKQLQHDLDLTVTAPDGTVYTMWDSGDADTVNVNERVVVPVISQGGFWTVKVSSKALLSDTQAYSLVVTGAVRNTGSY